MRREVEETEDEAPGYMPIGRRPISPRTKCQGRFSSRAQSTTPTDGRPV